MGVTFNPSDASPAAMGVARPANEPARTSRSVAAMPILYLVNQYPAVTHTFIRREILALERLGHPIERVSFRTGQGLVDELDLAERTRTTRLLENPVGLLSDFLRACITSPAGVLRATGLMFSLMRRSDRSPLHHLVSLGEACAVAAIMRAKNIRHVHAHFGTNPAEVALFAATIVAGTYSVTVHGYDEYDKPEFIGLALKIRHARFVAAVSHYGRSQLLRWCDAKDRDKIRLVRCGLGREAFRTLSTDRLASDHFVCVARLCREKAQETLIEAVALLAERGHHVRLTLIGDGDTRPDLEAMIAHLGLDAQVRLTGWQTGEEVRDHIASARALVVPSFAENLPVVIMEAMAQGKPVIATAIAGIPELVIQDVTGWLVPASSVELLVDAMAACLQAADHDLARMGERGRMRAAAQHDADQEAAKLSALFSSIPDRGSNARAMS